MSVDVKTPLGTADPEDGPASCIAVSNDGTVLLTGHPKGKILQWPLASDGHPSKVADVNASVTNLAFDPLVPRNRPTTSITVVARARDNNEYTFASQLENNLAPPTAFSRLLDAKGIPTDKLEAAILTLQQPPSSPSPAATLEDRTKSDELWQIIDQQRNLQEAYRK
jgi:pre-rRNA-processing protein IPI3